MNFRDFSLWVLRVERVRWVGGYGRMDTVDAESYAAAELDPVVRAAEGAVAHLNEDHADALLSMARALGGYPDASAATCASIDRYGLDLDPRHASAGPAWHAHPLRRDAERARLSCAPQRSCSPAARAASERPLRGVSTNTVRPSSRR